jgi:hypothetical protein
MVGRGHGTKATEKDHAKNKKANGSKKHSKVIEYTQGRTYSYIRKDFRRRNVASGQNTDEDKRSAGEKAKQETEEQQKDKTEEQQNDKTDEKPEENTEHMSSQVADGKPAEKRSSGDRRTLNRTSKEAKIDANGVQPELILGGESTYQTKIVEPSQGEASSAVVLSPRVIARSQRRTP